MLVLRDLHVVQRDLERRGLVRHELSELRAVLAHRLVQRHRRLRGAQQLEHVVDAHVRVRGQLGDERLTPERRRQLRLRALHDVQIAEDEHAAKLPALLGRLSDRERKVVELRHGLGGDAPRTLTEIGGQLSLSRERVRQIEKEAVQRLRAAAEQERAVA